MLLIGLIKSLEDMPSSLVPVLRKAELDVVIAQREYLICLSMAIINAIL